MNKKFLLLFIIIIPSFSIAQNLPEKLSKKICKCSKKENVTSLKEMDPCFESVLVKNLEDIYRYYNVKTIDEIDFDKLGAEIGEHLMAECDYLVPYLKDSSNTFEDDFVPEKNLDCSELKTGDFYYLLTNPQTKESDTTFVTIRDKMFLERMQNGRKYSLLDINWINDCQFELIFKNSNDIIKNAYSSEGDKYKYDVVSSSSNSFIMKLNWNNQVYKIELFKSK